MIQFSKASKLMLILLFILAGCQESSHKHPVLLLQTDFGVKDGAVAAMKGVAYTVDDNIAVFDLTHEIPAYNIWEGAYRLSQVVPFWPVNTVFVSVVDPGVGTNRKSIVAKTRTGQFIVTPDNGTLTLLAENPGIEAVREIDEKVNRREGSSESYTFHGRDVYVYVAARLAAGKITFEEVGPEWKQPLVRIPYQHASVDQDSIRGNIPVLDIQYGNVWTNIPDSLLKNAGFAIGDTLYSSFSYKDSVVYTGAFPLSHTFGDVKEGNPMAYYNSLMQLSFAINMGSLAEIGKISSGPGWSVEIRRLNR